MRPRYLGRDLAAPPVASIPAASRARLENALRYWSTVGELARCAHLVDAIPAGGVYACCAHPRSRLRCRACIVTHGGRGGHGRYGRCECGEEPLELVDEPPLVIDVAGFGPLCVVGFDLCRGCRDGA